MPKNNYIKIIFLSMLLGITHFVFFQSLYNYIWHCLLEKNMVRGQLSWGIYMNFQWKIVLVLSFIFGLLYYSFKGRSGTILSCFCLIHVGICYYLLSYSWNRFAFILALILLSFAVAFLLNRLVIFYIELEVCCQMRILSLVHFSSLSATMASASTLFAKEL